MINTVYKYMKQFINMSCKQWNILIVIYVYKNKNILKIKHWNKALKYNNKYNNK